MEPDYQEGSRLLKRSLDKAVANEGLSFSDALDIHFDALPGVLRAAINLRRQHQNKEQL